MTNRIPSRLFLVFTLGLTAIAAHAGVGLTPHDTYWAYVSRQSGLMERWEMVLTGQEAKDRAAFLWTDWQAVDGVRLALRKSAAAGSTVIRFDHVRGSTSPDEAAFKP